jgi:hypothetical protein
MENSAEQLIHFSTHSFGTHVTLVDRSAIPSLRESSAMAQGVMHYLEL